MRNRPHPALPFGVTTIHSRLFWSRHPKDAEAPLWKGQACVLQVSDACQSTKQLRALMDARNSSDAWGLRCHIREKLIEFVQKSRPQSVPRFRGELETRSSNPAT